MTGGYGAGTGEGWVTDSRREFKETTVGIRGRGCGSRLTDGGKGTVAVSRDEGSRGD